MNYALFDHPLEASLLEAGVAETQTETRGAEN